LMQDQTRGVFFESGGQLGHVFREQAY
jgi:hypothetical protein